MFWSMAAASNCSYWLFYSNATVSNTLWGLRAGRTHKMHKMRILSAGVKFHARGGPAKTRYCGHYFSRLMQNLSHHVQTDCLAYYMGEGQSREQGIWGYYWNNILHGLPPPIKPNQIYICTHLTRPTEA